MTGGLKPLCQPSPAGENGARFWSPISDGRKVDEVSMMIVQRLRNLEVGKVRRLTIIGAEPQQVAPYRSDLYC